MKIMLRQTLSRKKTVLLHLKSANEILSTNTKILAQVMKYAAIFAGKMKVKESEKKNKNNDKKKRNKQNKQTSKQTKNGGKNKRKAERINK